MIGKVASVLIIDDEKVACDLLYAELEEQGYLCTTALDGNDVLTKMATQHFEVALLDIRLPDISGVKVLAEIQSKYPDTSTIMITGVSDIDTVVEAMKLGALDYIVKPFKLDRVTRSIQTVLETNKQLQGKRNSKTVRHIGGKENRLAPQESTGRMDAIAYGVEARLDSLLGYSKMVTQRTIEIAQRLGVPEKEIQRWIAIRLRNNTTRNETIKSSLDKLERSTFAQKIMGVAVPYLPVIKPEESQN